MLMDFYGFTGVAAVVAVISAWLFGLFVVVLIIRAGVRWGMRDHQLWMEKTGRAASPTPYRPITPPDRQF